MKIILSVIAVCLVMITVKLYTSNVEAHDKKNFDDYVREHGFRMAVQQIIKASCIIRETADEDTIRIRGHVQEIHCGDSIQARNYLYGE